MECPSCYAPNGLSAVYCSKCGVKLPREKTDEREEKSSAGWIVGGLICALVSVFFCPPVFGILGIVFGFKATKTNMGVGIIIIFISAIGMIVGFVWGLKTGVDTYIKMLQQPH